MEYMVEKDGENVGAAIVKQAGLYVEVNCRCNNLQKGIYRLYMAVPENTILLGVLFPDGKSYTVCKKVPAKLLENGHPFFYLLTDREAARENESALQEGDPFPDLSRLRNGRLRRHNDGTYWIV